MCESGHIDNEGEWGAATFGSKGPEAKVEILEQRAVDSITKEIEKGMNRYIVNPFLTEIWSRPRSDLRGGMVRCVLCGAMGLSRWWALVMSTNEAWAICVSSATRLGVWREQETWPLGERCWSCCDEGRRRCVRDEECRTERMRDWTHWAMQVMREQGVCHVV